MNHQNKKVFCFFSISLVLVVLFTSKLIKDNNILNRQLNLQANIYQVEKDQYKQKIQNLSNQIDHLSSINNQLDQKNDELTEENEKLHTSIISLNNQQTSMIATLSQAFQSGYLKPSKTGFTPIFRFTSDSVDKEKQQESLARLSQGSYNFKQEIVTFSFDDMKEWKDVGDWFLTGYRVTKKECGSIKGITASGNIVTPGFTLGVDPKVWTYGTIFYVEDIGFVEAADCGGGVGGSKRGDFLVSSDIAYLITGGHHVWLVYSPNK